MKGQMIFEFIVAAVLFFSIVFYVINYLNAEVSAFNREYFVNELENKAVQISEFLTHNSGIWYGDLNDEDLDEDKIRADIIGLSDGWPVLNTTKMKMLDEYCIYHQGDLLDQLDMGMSVPYGKSFLKVVIKISEIETGKDWISNCGYEPQNFTYVKVDGFGITEEGKIVNMTVGVWG